MPLTIRHLRSPVSPKPSSSPAKPTRNYASPRKASTAPAWTDERLGTLLRLWTEHKLTVAEIAQSLGTTKGSVTGAIRKHNLRLTRTTGKRK